jgi:hypothetical protein
MKHTLILRFALLSLLSANCFAIQINGGKLISHKEWTKGNVIKSFFKNIESSAALNIPLNRLHQNDGINWISASSTTTPFPQTSIPVKTDATFTGNSNMFIENDDPIQKTFTIISTLFVNPPCISGLCPTIILSSEDVVTLDPYGTLKIDKNPTLTTNFTTTGAVSYFADINVRANNISFDAPGHEETIQVTDSKK